ncbi:MAG TPA: hypothetical protein VMU59_01330 [Caulobacteraceae bacterium]|nr:hypothetical protein [Caulobacteraceae bacterium]
MRRAQTILQAIFQAIATAAVLAAPAWAQAPMPINGVRVDADGVTFRLPVSACATKADYTVAMLKTPGQIMLLIAPRRQGACSPTGPGHMDLTYSYADLDLRAGAPFVLGNPLVGAP